MSRTHYRMYGCMERQGNHLGRPAMMRLVKESLDAIRRSLLIIERKKYEEWYSYRGQICRIVASLIATQTVVSTAVARTRSKRTRRSNA